MRKHLGRKFGFTAAVILASSFPVNISTAQQAGIPFQTVPDFDQQFCQIVLGEQGILASNVDNTVLASTELGGRTGKATVLVSDIPGSNFRLSGLAFNGFTSFPAGADLSNVTTSGEIVVRTVRRNGTVRGPRTRNTNGIADVRVPRGSTSDVEVDFEAVNNAGPFPGGNYLSQVTLTCQ